MKIQTYWVFLLHYASQNTKKIFLCPDPKQNATRRSKVWDMQLCQQALGSDVCESILFIHAILGCDTTSSLYEIGKGLSLKAFMHKEQFKQQEITFSNELSSKEQIVTAGEIALPILYYGKDDDLDQMRYSMFHDKLVSSKTQIKPEVLPPTSSASKYRSMWVFCQVMQWKGREIHPNKWGWKITNNMMIPKYTDLPCAPEGLLKIISCNCKTDCSIMRCSCKKNGLICSFTCGECRGYSCGNSMQPELEEEIKDTV